MIVSRLRARELVTDLVDSGGFSMNRITIEYPDDLLIALGATVEQFEQEAKFTLAAKLFELGRLSSGKAARLAGMDRITFLLTLHRVGIAVLDLDEKEMEDETRYARGE